MSTIPQGAEAMHTVLTSVADTAGRETGCVQRQVKLSGAGLTQTLVFGWLANPQATLEELSQTAATLGIAISPQGLDQRFTPAAAACLEQGLAAAVERVIATDPVALPLLQRFQGVYLQDSTVIALSAALAEVWAGCGGRPGEGTAACKLQVRLDLRTGALQGPLLQAGRAHDRSSPLQTAPLPAGALRIADLGYFSLAVFRDVAAQGSFWLSRWQAGTVVYDATGRRWDLRRLLAAQGTDAVDLPIQLGRTRRLPCRLLAVRVPPTVAAQRRRRLRLDARRRGQAVSAAQLALADWTIFRTNVPPAQLTLGEALVLARTRWQIELLFKLWKSHGAIDESRSEKPWRLLCELYAKLLAMLVQHWILVVGAWRFPERSLTKAAQTVRKQALHLASAFGRVAQLCRVLRLLQRCLAVGCRINKRKTAPSTYQLLLTPALGGLA